MPVTVVDRRLHGRIVEGRQPPQIEHRRFDAVGVQTIRGFHHERQRCAPRNDGHVPALASAYVVITIRQLHATEHTSTIFAAQCIYGIFICAIPALLHSQTVSTLAWSMMVLAGLFAAVGQITMTRAFRDLPVAEGSLLQMLVPLGIAIGGVVFFAEHFASHELVGAALILGGTAVTAVRR